MKHATRNDANAAWDAHVASSIRKRLLMLQRVSSPRDMAITRHVVSQDTPEAFVTFVNDWCWTYNPRAKTAKEMPFVLWDKQAELAAAMHAIEHSDGWLFIEKSRDTGVTWLAAAYAAWRWLFVPNWRGTFGSRNESLLDSDGNPDSLFYKILFIIEKLPRFLLPRDWDARKHRKHRQILNPENGSVITGDVGKDMGRGGRSSVYFIDEFATIEHAQAVEASVSGNTNAIISITTTTGPGTYVHQVRERAATTVKSISWLDDPRKHSGFLDEYIHSHSAELAKREYEISWDGDTSNQFVPNDWLRTCIRTQPIETDGLVQAGLDVSDRGEDSSVLVIRKGSTVILIREYTNIDPVALVDAVLPVCVAYGVTRLVYDATGVGAGVGGALNKLSDSNMVPFDYVGINNGSSPDAAPMWDDGFDRPCRERFSNIKAQQWWNIRMRALATVDFVQKGIGGDRMLFLPQMSGTEVMVKELSTPSLQLDNRNKVRVESKESLAKRGVKSPDFADACVLAFAEFEEVVLSWV